MDPAGRRRRRVQILAVALGSVSFAAIVVFAISLLSVPILPHVPGLSPALRHAARPSFPTRPARARMLEAEARKRLVGEIAGEERARRTGTQAAVDTTSMPVVGAFYAGWQDAGLHSLQANADRLTHVFPVWLRLAPGGDGLDTRDWDPAVSPGNMALLRLCRDHRIAVHPVLANASEGVFDRQRGHLLLSDSTRQEQVARLTRDWLVAHGFRGLNVDLENLTAEDAARVPQFLACLRHAFAPDGLALSFDLEIEGEVPTKELARWCDFVVLMGYDQHGRNDRAGSISGARWFAGALDRVLRDIPPSKVVCGIGAYGYDWTEGNPPADVLTYQEAVTLVADERPDDRPEDAVDFDANALNATYNYRDDAGRVHEVWVLDAISAANQRLLALARGVRGQALWVLGSEDPDVWSFIDKAHPDARPDSSGLAATTFPFNVGFSGDGDLLSVESYPERGSRTLEQDPSTGLFVDESYRHYPSPFILGREGFHPGVIALTFDDGPSPWTGALLDLLAHDGVHATFFVIGQNAERHPDLIRRIWNEGHEIGNHTFTHPNLAAVPPERLRLELNATQRVLEANLGRSTMLFRAPYDADAEPTTADEVTPIIGAASVGYLTVGVHLDPQDWNLVVTDSSGATRPRTGRDIARAVLDEVGNQKGNTILLHDGGGDRTRTLEALTQLIPILKRKGYRFVTVSELAGLTRAQVMPVPGTRDRALGGVNRATLGVAFVIETFLYWAFLTAIALGAARVLWVTTLALIASRRRSRPVECRAPVSVLIAAHNEQAVIARTLRAVLAGDRPPLEVIVVDDGSTDGTATEVMRIAAEGDRVRLVRQTKAGKAAALNRALALSHGEILVCLDADTLFTPATVGRLARHFSDPAVGAVAGNVKVGNRVNLWTRWQGIEYVVSQNLDRRAYGLLNAIIVVPGAVGAWRREAVVRAGGFRPDTMAEDMDLTWRLRRGGWRIHNEPEALGFTEVPDSLAGLFRQRFRWTYGTLQCLWKHRDALGGYGWFGRVALPALWLFQIAYQVLSPVIDLQILWTLGRVGSSYLSSALLTRDWQPLPQAVESFTGIVTLFAFFFLLELGGAAVAYLLERESPRDLLWLFWQRFVYRQLMYAAALRSVREAVVGRRASWGKLERKGTVRVART